MIADESELFVGCAAETLAMIKAEPAVTVAGLNRATGGAENIVGGAATPTKAPEGTTSVLAWVAAAHA